VDGPYYNISPDARYIPYPPQLEFSHLGQPVMPGTGSLRRLQHRGPVVPPPDVTVSHNPPPHSALSTQQQQQQQQNGPTAPTPLLSTFNPTLSYPATMETEGHLVWLTFRPVWVSVISQAVSGAPASHYFALLWSHRSLCWRAGHMGHCPLVCNSDQLAYIGAIITHILKAAVSGQLGSDASLFYFSFFFCNY
jgi:hypothetical protein